MGKKDVTEDGNAATEEDRDCVRRHWEDQNVGPWPGDSEDQD